MLPFIILSDINMPKLNGLELHKKLKTNADLQLKCIPYLFFSTAANQPAVVEAYSMSAQGFFIKQNTLQEQEKTIPVHWGKFQLANHDWDAPIKELLALNEEKQINICTPMIGQKVLLNGEQLFEQWWESVK